MAKRKITVTVDEEHVAAAQALGVPSLSAVVNVALEREVDRRARLAALERLVDDLVREHGMPSDEDLAWAADAFDEAEGVAPAPRTRRRRGAA